MKEKMTIDIWSDIRCPFCYIGKRKFENALNAFEHKDKVEVEWHSFELDPNMTTQPGVNAVEYIAAAKGISRQQSEDLHNHVTRLAKDSALEFNFGSVVVANSFNAHRLIQLAKTKGLGDEAEEELFKSHFTEGKNIDNRETLAQIGGSIGLDEKEVNALLSDDAFTKEVKEDEIRAQSMGIRGVPFFVFDEKYAVSGAQSSDIFLSALEQSWMAFNQERKIALNEAEAGEICSTTGNCNI